MTSNTTTCNGGLIRFIPFKDDWISQFLLQSLEHVQLRIVIAVLAISILLFLVFVLRLCYRRSKQQSHYDSASIQSEGSQSGISLQLHCFKTQDYEWVDDLWHPELKTSNKTRWKKLDSNFTPLSDSYASSEERIASASLINPLFKFYRRRITILSIVSALFVICLVSHLASLIIAVRSEQNLVNSLNALPVQIHLISRNGVGFVRFAMDITVNISKAHILNDAHRLDNGSWLQGFVREIKVLVSQVVACLAYDCFNLTDKRSTNLILLPLENTSQSDMENHRLIAEQLLQSFELVIKRFENLNTAAQELNPNTIQKIQRSWYEYRQDLSTLVPNNPILSHLENEQNWASYDLVRQTRTLLCTYLNQSKLEQFESCNQVETYMNQLVQYANQLPYMMPSKRLESVTGFTLIPRALNAEQLINQWMPVLYDLPGRGLVFLLDTFLKPEINKAELNLIKLSNTFPPTEIINQFAVYTRYLNSALIISFVLFVTFAVIICSAYLILFLRQWKKIQKCHNFLTNWNRFNHNVSDFHRLINERTSCTSIFPLLGLILLAILTMLLVTMSLGLLYASVLSKLEGCDVLTNENQHSDEVDQILTKRLEFTASIIPQLAPFLAIDHLDLQYPKHILTMFNNPYQDGQKSLLDQIEMTRPVNFTALLESQWTLDQIHKAWNKDVHQKLSRIDLKSQIPQINLTQIYEKTVKTLDLARSFDNLEVGQVTNYLNDPGSNWFLKFRQSLEQIPNQEAHKLAKFYEQLDKRYSNYSDLYENTKNALQKIDENKALLEVVSILVETGSRILHALDGKTNNELIELVDQFLPVIFPKLKPLGERYLLPFLENLLVDLIPYNGLNEIYRETLQLACPITPEQDSVTNVQPLVGEIRTMAISMTSLGITLLLLCLIYSILF